MERIPFKARFKAYKKESVFSISCFTDESKTYFILDLPDGNYFVFKSLSDVETFLHLNYEI